jgi:hypothetical protein
MMEVDRARNGGTIPSQVMPAPENDLKQTGNGRELPNMLMTKSMKASNPLTFLLTYGVLRYITPIT